MGEQDVADQRGAFACRGGPGLMPWDASRVLGPRTPFDPSPAGVASAICGRFLSAGGTSLSGAPATMPPGSVRDVRLAQRRVAPSKANDCASPSGSMVRRFNLRPCVTLPSADAIWSFGAKKREPARSEALLWGGDSVPRVPCRACMESSKLSFCGLLRIFEGAISDTDGCATCINAIY